MHEWLDEKVFAVGNEEYRWRDVVLAAHAWGDWAALENDVRHILACVERLRESPDAPSPEELDDAANEFRYERDLVSADEMEAWLDARNLTADLWMEHILGAVSTQKCADLGVDIVPDAALTDADIEEFLLAEATCGGSLDRWARKLAGRAAVAATEQDRAGASTEAEPTDVTGDDDSADPEALGRLVGLEPDVARQSLDRLSRLEGTFRSFGQRVVTPGSIREQIGIRRLEWIRVLGQKVSFPSEAMAREAVMCMKEDRRELGDVAEDAGQMVHEVQAYLVEIGADFRDRFLAARKQDLVGPVPVGEGFELWLILDKVLPSPDDPEIRERAEHEVLRRAVEREITDRVRWDRP